MNGSIKNILKSELQAAIGYLDRLIWALGTNASFENHPKVKEKGRALFIEMQTVMAALLKSEAAISTPSDFSLKELKIKNSSSAKMIEAILDFGVYPNEMIELTVEFINTIYLGSQKIHQFALEQAGFNIEYPRLNLLQMHPVDTAQNSVPLFELPLDSVLELGSDELAIIHSLDHKREKRYEKLIEQGHQAVIAKDPAKALEIFNRAREFNDSSEVLTLIGWAHSLLGQFEKAKSLCLRAIEKDPDYGPPYNDLGTYLMQDGQIDEAIKWFNLAKRTTNYNNREYPYINSGRAHLSKKDFEKALNEFNRALELAPHHKELLATIDKIRKIIASQKQEATLPPLN